MTSLKKLQIRNQENNCEAKINLNKYWKSMRPSKKRMKRLEINMIA